MQCLELRRSKPVVIWSSSHRCCNRLNDVCDCWNSSFQWCWKEYIILSLMVDVTNCTTAIAARPKLPLPLTSLVVGDSYVFLSEHVSQTTSSNMMCSSRVFKTLHAEASVANGPKQRVFHNGRPCSEGCDQLRHSILSDGKKVYGRQEE